MRIKAALLTFDKMKSFREMLDLDYRAFQVIMDNADVVAEAKGGLLGEILFNDPYAYFLLSGCVQLNTGLLGKHPVVRCEDKEARAMLNHLVPKGGKVEAREDGTVLLVVKRTHINEARLEYNQPLDFNTAPFQPVEEGIEESDEQDWMSSLLSSPLFNRLEPSKLQGLLLGLQEKSYQEGETIIHHGQRDEYFYVIKSGQAEVVLGDESQQDNVKKIALRPGQFFGEGALTGDTVHSATVKMRQDGVVCLVHIDQFDQIIKSSLLEYLDQHQLEQLLYSDDDPALVLDVRYPVEYRSGHRERSINVPISKLRDRINRDFSKDATYLIDYGEDKRSQVAAMILIENGFSALLIGEEKEDMKQEGSCGA